MPNKKIYLVLVIVLLVLLSACTPKIPKTESEVPRVTVEDAKSALDNGKAVIVDVRSVQAYAEGHVAGAISIPLAEFENNIDNLPLDKRQWIITYCTWLNEHTSARAAFLLLQNGYTKSTPILGGFTTWVEAGYPTEQWEMNQKPILTPWTNSEPPTQSMLWKLMIAEGLDPYAWSNNPLYIYIAHTHPRHKVLYVVQGSITFGLPELGQSLTMKAGDRLDLPAGTLHDAHVGVQGVVCLEGYK